jgi:hypothetical protein
MTQIDDCNILQAEGGLDIKMFRGITSGKSIWISERNN